MAPKEGNYYILYKGYYTQIICITHDIATDQRYLFHQTSARQYSVLSTLSLLSYKSMEDKRC
jgi:hypothetical protein